MLMHEGFAVIIAYCCFCLVAALKIMIIKGGGLIKEERPPLARMKQQPAVKGWVMERHTLFMWRLLAV